MPGDEPAQWFRVHHQSTRSNTGSGVEAYRVRIEASSRPLGSIWALRERRLGEPDLTETRLLAAAADQLGQALAHDRLAAEAHAAEIARQSDALKSALLQSVSHDLRTPLATIRAAAGTLALGRDPRRGSAGERRRDRPRGRVPQPARDEPARPEPDRGGRAARRREHVRARRRRRPRPRAPRPTPRRPAASRSTSAPRRSTSIRSSSTRPFTNVVENALKHTPAEHRLRICATARRGRPRPADDRGRRPRRPGRCTAAALREVLPRARAAGGSRSGTGIGLAVVRGLVEAMGGRVGARRERARRARDRPRPSDARNCPAELAAARVTRPRRADAPARRSGRRGRRRDARGARPRAWRPAATGRWRLPTARVAPSNAGRRAGRTSSCSTSACPTSTASHVIRRIRREAATPIVILSGRYDEREKVEALERGADDYVTKPFGVDELNARLRVALRRCGRPDGRRGRVGRRRAPRARRGAHEVRVDGERVDLTPREFEILRVLLAHAGRLVTKGRLLRSGLGRGVPGRGQLRLRPCQPAAPQARGGRPRGVLRDLIVTEPGVGYRVRGVWSRPRP